MPEPGQQPDVFGCSDDETVDAQPVDADAVYRLLADNTRDVVLVFCPDLTVQWASPSLRSVLGVDPAAIIGDREQLVDGRDRAAADRALRTAIAEHQDHVRGRLRVPHSDGRQLWFDASATLVWADSGALRHAIVSLRDITAEVTARRALAHSEKRFRTAMADSAIGMALVATDGRFLAVNRALCDFFGHDEATLLTKSWQELTHPFDLEKDLAGLQRLRSGGTDHYRVTKRYIHADGSVLVGDLRVSAIRDGGQLSHLVTQIVDVTEQTRVQLELAQSEEHFRLIADNASDVIVRATNDGIIQWISSSITTARGWAPEDMVGRAFTDFVHPEDVPTARLVQQGVRGGQQGKFEARIRSAGGGDHRWFAITVSPIRAANGIMTGRVASWRDVDDEVAARQLAAAREAEFRLLAEHASDLVLRIGADDRIEWVSPSVLSALGWLPDDMVGRPATDFLDPPDLERYAETVATLQPGMPARASGRVRCGDGTYRWFAGIATRMVADEGADLGRVVGLRDVDADVASLESVGTTEASLRAAMESAPAGMAIVGLDLRFVHVNDALVDLVGRDREWFLAHCVTDVLAAEDRDADLAMREALVAGQNPATVVERRIEFADGSQRWVLHSVGLLRDDSGRPAMYFSQFVDIDQSKQARSDLEFQATHDALTRLPNRRALLGRMEEALDHPADTDARVGVLFLDLDSLKAVNDRYGHLVGDSLLVAIGERLTATLREEDLVARLGGDEFVCLLSSVTDGHDLATIAQKIHRAVAAPVTIQRHHFAVTASIGATLALPGDRAEDVIAHADEGLYRAKRAGGNRIQVVDAAASG